MIKINLAPIEELDSQFWWVPDFLVGFIVFAVAYFAVTYYIGSIDDQIKAAYAEKSRMESTIAKLDPEVKRHTSLLEKRIKLSEKVDALKNITKVKLSRYMPVIVLEHIQNMKPAGVWFEELEVKKQGEEISLKGRALSNELIAEYIKILKESVNNLVDANDLRTQVYFYSDTLSFTRKSGDSERFPEVKNVVDFDLLFYAKTHESKDEKNKKENKNLKNKKKKS